MYVMEKALKRVRKLLNYDDVDFDNIGISCGDRFEITKIINLDTDDKVILYSVKEIDEKFKEVSDLVHLAWQIELAEKDMLKNIEKTED